ncbi:hypothetical protein [Halovenus salina]|uniref:TraB family protein n=1 Tax=Halovenus salina TaxID=1510225 RepID=A0ABD5VZM4_9EURY
MLRPKATARKTPTWPTPTPEQVEVIVLGTYHMDEPGLDKVNVAADDVLVSTRQRELSSFVSHLPRPTLTWSPLSGRPSKRRR